MSTVELYNIEEQKMTAQVSCDSRQSWRSSTVVLLQSDWHFNPAHNYAKPYYIWILLGVGSGRGISGCSPKSPSDWVPITSLSAVVCYLLWLYSQPFLI